MSPIEYFGLPVPCVVQNRKTGLISHVHDYSANPASQQTVEEQIVDASQEVYSMGLMSQEVGGLSPGQATDTVNHGSTLEGSMEKQPPIYQSGNAYRDICSSFEVLFGRLEHSPTLESQIKSEIFEALQDWHKLVDQEK